MNEGMISLFLEGYVPKGLWGEARRALENMWEEAYCDGQEDEYERNRV